MMILTKMRRVSFIVSLRSAVDVDVLWLVSLAASVLLLALASVTIWPRNGVCSPGTAFIGVSAVVVAGVGWCKSEGV